MQTKEACNMLIEKVDFKAISKFRGKNIVPVMVCIGDDYYEITPRISKSDNSWGIFQKLFYNKIYSIEKGKNFIDGLLEVPVFSSNIIVFSKTERTFHNNTANKGDTAAKFAEDRYAIIMSKSYNNLVMAKKVINGTKISNIDLYVADKNDFSEKEYQYEISILKKQCINEQESKRIRKAGIIVGHINNAILTDEEKLVYFVRSEFKKKKLLGDIILDDNQEKTLHEFMCKQMKRLVNGLNTEYNRVFAFGLIRYAMKYYNKNHSGEFWPYFKEEYGVDLSTNRQKDLHKIFQNVMEANGKAYAEDIGYRIDNITMHSFVADNSSEQLFDFLLDFWKNDLGRNSDNMSNSSDGEQEFAMLIEAMQNRTQNVMTHTSTLLGFSQTKGIFKTRIRRIIKMINNSFWNDVEAPETGNRINHLLNEWMRNPNGAFQKEKNYVAKHSTHGKGEILYHSPMLTINPEDNKMCIVLPQQRLIECDANDYPEWEIETMGDLEKIQVKPEYKCDRIGYYVEKSKINLPIEKVLNGFKFTLFSLDKELKKYRIAQSNIRFFDSKNKCVDHLKALVPEGYVTAYSDSKKYPNVLDTDYKAITYKKMYVWNYNLIRGQIIVLDDGTGIQVGQNIHEGLSEVYPIKGANIQNKDGDEFDIYTQLPKLLFKASKNDISGVSLVINGKQNQVVKKGVKEFKLTDDVLTYGYLIDLNNYINRGGLYSIVLTFPKYKQPKEIANMAYIKGFYYEFLKSPYVFKSKADLAFKNDSGIVIEKKNNGGIWECEKGKNIFSFNFGDRNPNSDNFCPLVEDRKLKLTYNLEGKKYPIFFSIPALYWKYNANDEWNTNQPADILLKDLNRNMKKLYVSGPFNFESSSLFTDDADLSEEESEIRIQGGKQPFYDLSKAYEWFRSNRIQRLKKIKITLGGETYNFLNVICKSQLKEINLFGDFENNCIKGNVNIEGNETYSISISYGDQIICEDEQIIDNQFCIKTDIKTGNYSINVYELSDEEDEDGFDIERETIKLNVKPIIKRIINVYNLEGRTIKINNIVRQNSYVKGLLSKEYYVKELKRTSYKEIIENGDEILGIWDTSIDTSDDEIMSEMLYYKGVLYFRDKKGEMHEYIKVLVIFKKQSDVDSILILQENQNVEGYYSYESLMVDTFEKSIIKKESKNMKLFLKLVFDDEYQFLVDFL